VSRSFDPRVHAYEEQTRHAGALYVLMVVIACAFGGFVWQVYSGPETPRIAAAPGPYKIAPPTEPAPDAAELGALTTPETETAALDEAGLEATETAGPPQLAAAPQFSANGPFVAQLAALQSEAGVDPEWRRMASRAPQLFAAARLDVERADLGARGIYYRMRAGYFADRANAARFCERIRQMGQECIVAAR
jgi:hypothetical protein